MVAKNAMLRACSSAISISAARCCSTWKLPIGTPNCFLVLRYSTVISCIAAMAPTASAASAAIAVSHLSDKRKCLAGLAQNAIRPDPHTRQGHFRGAQAVDRRIASARYAGRIGVDHEQSNSIAIATRACKTRRHDELVGAVAMNDEALGAVEDVIGAVAPRRGRDIREVV